MGLWKSSAAAQRKGFVPIAAAFIAASAPGEDAAAQRVLPLSSLKRGDTVRVWTHGPPLVRTVAVVSRIGADNLELADVPGRPVRLGAVDVPIAALTRLQVQRGRGSSTADGVVGFALGSTAGAVVGALAGGVACLGARQYDSICAGFGGAGLGGMAGAVAGAFTGVYLANRPRPRWRPVGLSPPSP